MTVKSLVTQIGDWFRVSTPEPTHQNFNTQTGVHYEEVAEMGDCLTGLDQESAERLYEVQKVLKAFATDLKKGVIKIGVTDHKELLDSLCDQNVTSNGMAVLADYDFEEGLQETADSNDSKFVDGKPIRDPQSQKIIKGPNYFRVDHSGRVLRAKFGADRIYAVEEKAELDRLAAEEAAKKSSENLGL